MDRASWGSRRGGTGVSSGAEADAVRTAVAQQAELLALLGGSARSSAPASVGTTVVRFGRWAERAAWDAAAAVRARADSGSTFPDNAA